MRKICFKIKACPPLTIACIILETIFFFRYKEKVQWKTVASTLFQGGLLQGVAAPRLLLPPPQPKGEGLLGVRQPGGRSRHQHLCRHSSRSHYWQLAQRPTRWCWPYNSSAADGDGSKELASLHYHHLWLHPRGVRGRQDGSSQPTGLAVGVAELHTLRVQRRWWSGARLLAAVYLSDNAA